MVHRISVGLFFDALHVRELWKPWTSKQCCVSFRTLPKLATRYACLPEAWLHVIAGQSAERVLCWPAVTVYVPERHTLTGRPCFLPAPVPGPGQHHGGALRLRVRRGGERQRPVPLPAVLQEGQHRPGQRHLHHRPPRHHRYGRLSGLLQ